MDISNASAISAAADAQTTTSASDAASIDADFDTFLTLLTAQLTNQDPLKPIDSTEFVAQLAQFSTVEQQVRGNDTLDAILAALGGGVTGLANWLGAKVEAPAALRFSGEPIALTKPADSEATSARLVVTDASGTVVARPPLDVTATSFEWDGRGLNGEPVEAGLYRFTIERFSGNERLDDQSPKGFASVTEARLVDGEAILILDGGDTIAAEQVTAIK